LYTLFIFSNKLNLISGTVGNSEHARYLLLYSSDGHGLFLPELRGCGKPCVPTFPVLTASRVQGEPAQPCLLRRWMSMYHYSPTKPNLQQVVVVTHAYGDCVGIRYLTNGLKVLHLVLARACTRSVNDSWLTCVSPRSIT
jgi:hypothetical protein